MFLELAAAAVWRARRRRRRLLPPPQKRGTAPPYANEAQLKKNSQLGLDVEIGFLVPVETHLNGAESVSPTDMQMSSPSWPGAI